jgi:hypothetical protein
VSHKRFYEKVINLKADMAAVLNYFFPQLGTKRNAVQLSFVSWWSGCGSLSSAQVDSRNPPGLFLGGNFRAANPGIG